MLITTMLNENFLSVQFNYCTEYINRIKTIPGATFDGHMKKWVIPTGAFDYYEEEFEGEILYNTPRWIITGEEPPDYSKMYSIDKSIKVPSLKVAPYDYQNFGIRFMIDKLRNQKFIINADGVGLGKTLQAIGTMKHYMDNEGYKKILIVCKKSLKKQWKDEIDKFTDLSSNTFIDYTKSSKPQRNKLYGEIQKHSRCILITNYHTVMNDSAFLMSLGFEMVIIDEAHCVKARTGVINKAMTEACKPANKVIFLTGTPVMSKPDDLFGIVQIADKKYFGTWKDFNKRYIKEQYQGRFLKTVGYMHLDELRDMVQNIIIRRTEHEVTLQLPQTIEKSITVTMDSTQKKIQDLINEDRMKISAELDALELKKSKPGVAELIAQKDGISKGLIAALQACANDPRLFDMSKSGMMKKRYAPLVPKTYKQSAKMEALVELVDEVLQANQKIIIFSKFERCCRLIKQDLEHALGVNVLLYTGEICDEERDMNIDTFKNSFDHNIIVLTDAGAEGLNLQVANHVVNFDLPFTPAIKTQRGGRARRAGSAYSRVFTYDLLTEESYDMSVKERLDKANSLFKGLVDLDDSQSKFMKNVMSEGA